MQFTAKTTEEAIALGLETLGIEKEQADVIIIEEPTKGLFGRVKGKAVVDIVSKQTDLERATAFVQKVLDLMGLDVKAVLNEEGENAVINLEASEASFLTGHHGEVLDAIQTLAGASANIGNKVYKKVVVDCESYRGKREDTLIKLAKKLEAKATEMKREVILEPMSPFERRIIHMALSESTTVTTKSDGKEPNRYVVIVPNDKDEFSKPYNAGRNNDRGRRDNKRDNGRGGKGGKNFGRRDDRRGARKPQTSGEKKKSSSTISFGTYLGNSLKDNI